jgi:hypothetical protein
MTSAVSGAHAAMHYLADLLRTEGRWTDPIVSPRTVGSRFGRTPRKTLEVIGTRVEISNPLDRRFPKLCREVNETFLVANTFWNMSPQAEARDIIPFNERGRSFLDDSGELVCSIPGRLFGYTTNENQLESILKLLREDMMTRRAIVSFLRPSDLDMQPRDFPCPASAHFLVRDGKLDCVLHMRSQSLIGVFPYDAFLFTSMQEAIAIHLGLAPGSFFHLCGSLHIYEDELGSLDRVLACREFSVPMQNMNTDFLLTLPRDFTALAQAGQAERIMKGEHSEWVDMVRVLAR